MSGEKEKEKKEIEVDQTIPDGLFLLSFFGLLGLSLPFMYYAD